MTYNDDNILTILDSVDAIDELYSDLLYAAPVWVRTPDARRWEVWIYSKDETLQIRHLDDPCRDGWQHEPDSFVDAYRYLRGGVVTPCDEQG